MNNYPGTPAQRRLLQAITAFYVDDPRILTVGLFGSLSRGNWDGLSDLDLDVVLADGVKLDVLDEVRRLTASLAALDESPTLIVPDGEEAADVMLPSLNRFSIRYHPLATTNPNIVDSLQLLAGSLDLAAVQAAGRANQPAAEAPLEGRVDAIVRYMVEVDVALRRGRLWLAVELLHRIRGLLMEIYSHTRGGSRPLLDFDEKADAALQGQLGQTLPQYDLASLQAALAKLIHLLQHDLPVWSGGRLQLDPVQEAILQQVVDR
jgi:predicted nucleotidyltransferase